MNEKKELKKSIWKELSTYFIILVLIILIRSFVITPIRVNGSSMEPTLSHADIMILNKISYKFTQIKRFDIVVVKYHDDSTDDYLIKRVIGLPGETLRYENNQLYINDQIIEEDFEHYDTSDFNIEDINYQTIPNNCYVVLGDNRNNSTDSRIIGCINKQDILGKTSLVLFPFKNFGIKK